jgi:WXG100 family type VII secretion target
MKGFPHRGNKEGKRSGIKKRAWLARPTKPEKTGLPPGANNQEKGTTMAGQIRITPDIMDQRAGEYRQRETEVNDIISKMDGMLTTLMSEWEGEAARSYQERWQSDLKPSFQRASELIEEIAVALNKTASILRDTDAQIAAQLRG